MKTFFLEKRNSVVENIIFWIALLVGLLALGCAGASLVCSVMEVAGCLG